MFDGSAAIGVCISKSLNLFEAQLFLSDNSSLF